MMLDMSGTVLFRSSAACAAGSAGFSAFALSGAGDANELEQEL
jgi:hypothetical protein